MLPPGDHSGELMEVRPGQWPRQGGPLARSAMDVEASGYYVVNEELGKSRTYRFELDEVRPSDGATFSGIGLRNTFNLES